MISNLLKKVFGSRNDRLLKQYRGTVAKVNALEAAFEKLGDAALRDKTTEFKARLEKGEALDALLPEAFAAVREAAKRVHGMRLITPNWNDNLAAKRRLAAAAQDRAQDRVMQMAKKKEREPIV